MTNEIKTHGWCRLTDSNCGPPHYEAGPLIFCTALIPKGFTWSNCCAFLPGIALYGILFAGF